LPFEQDVNDPKALPRGYFMFEDTIDRKGERSSTYRAFLPKALALERRSRLAICTGVVVTKLEVKPDAGLVTGVHFRPRKSGATKACFVSARREIIICSGAICTPQLLLLR